jgi:sugar phosphate isomerase/epimerase
MARSRPYCDTGNAEIVDRFPDALGDRVTVGWLPGVVLVGVTGSPAILDTPELRDRFAKAWAEAERRAEAHGAVSGS